MKKICLIIYLLSIFVLSNFKVYAVSEEDVVKENENVEEVKNTLDLAKNATSAIMLESSTGEIIFQKNANEKRPPASMTKMMSMLLIMENIEKGNLTFEEEVTASAYASSMGGSQIFLKAGENMKVEDLLKGIAIGSGNDATVAMSERIAGTEEAFVKLMNDRAKELGLTNTNFKNPSGLTQEGHLTTAHDLALIMRYASQNADFVRIAQMPNYYFENIAVQNIR